MKNKTVILESKEIRQKIVRIAYEIYENHFEEELILLGIEGTGLKLAKMVHVELEKISNEHLSFHAIKVNKQAPRIDELKVDNGDVDLTGKTIVLIDDVINSGKTMAFAVFHLLSQSPGSIKVAVLVDRQHRQYPVKTDYVGLTLSTTLQDHIEVNLEKEEAYLV